MKLKIITNYCFLLSILAVFPAFASIDDPQIQQNFFQQIINFFSGNLASLTTSIIKAVGNIWNYAVYTTTDKQPITVANLTIGMVLLVFGLQFARHLADVTRRRVLNRLNIDPSVRILLEKLLHYIYIVFVTLIVLDLAHVPLTIFTLLGGALALSIGLGSQNILSNFISGLIIMLEQPIRVGDMIEVNDQIGRVVSIGARCINLRTGNNIDILVPNNTILQSTVINWSLNDNNIRVSTSINVGLTAPIKLVEEILHKVLLNNRDILQDPAPQVFFSSFSDGAIKFEIFFWIDLNSPTERRAILSEINHEAHILLERENVPLAVFYPLSYK